MADFYRIHRRAIVGALERTKWPGDRFCILIWEPLPYFGSPCDPASSTSTIIEFERFEHGRFRPARDCDHKAIAEWTERHKDDDDAMWEIPTFAGTA